MNAAHLWRLTVIPLLITLLLAGDDKRTVAAEDKPAAAAPGASPASVPAARPNAEAEKLAASRLERMKETAREYEFLLGPDFKSKLTLEPVPLLRFTNPVSGLQDGGFFLWVTPAGRPAVGAQLFLTSEDLWIHEFQSLTTEKFRVNRAGKAMWTPQREGVDVRRVPDAPVPAGNPAQRLAQMRDLAKRFEAFDKFEGRADSDELRLLTKPLARFGANSDTLDGALFVHAHGTDPELMIVLEAFKADGGYRWHYSLAPMTGYALKASFDGKPVWDVAWRQPPYDPREPFFAYVHSREPTLKSLTPTAKP